MKKLRWAEKAGRNGGGDSDKGELGESFPEDKLRGTAILFALQCHYESVEDIFFIFD